MTYSFFIECEDCEKKYRIRYGLGNNYPQFAAFQCDNCSKNIEVGFNKFEGEKIINGGRLVTVDDSEYYEVQVQNLHPEIPTHTADKSNPYYFQTTNVFHNVFKTNLEQDEFKEEQKKWSTFNSKWKKVEKGLRILSTKGRFKLKEICDLSYSEFLQQFNDWLSIYVSGKMEDNYDKMCDEYNLVNLSSAKNFIKNDDKIFNKIYDLCSTYMNQSHQFQSTILYQKFGWHITTDMTANVNWNEIDTIYGDLYEIIGDLFIIPTMINNIREGRDYDKFKSENFTLEKYRTTDKANRAKNFGDNSNLAFLAESYHSWLRNGTHHKNSYFDAETNEIDLGTSKGGIVIKKILLTEYIKKTNDMFFVGLILSSLALNMKK